MNRRHITGKMASVLASTLLACALSVAANVIVTRALGPAQRGVLSLAMVLSASIMILSDLGMRSALLYFTSRAEDSHRAMEHGIAVCFRLVGVSFLVGALLYAAVLLAGSGAFFRGISGAVLLRSYVYFAALLLVDILTILFMGLRDFGARNMMATLPSAIYAALVAGNAFLHRGFTASAALEFLIAAQLCAFGAGAITLAVRHKPAGRCLPPVGWLREYLSYGSRSLIAQFAVQINSRLDAFIVNSLLTTDAVGLYAASASLAEMTQHLSSAASVVLYPELGALRRETRAAVVAKTAGGTFYSMLTACALLAAVLPLAVHLLFGREFAPAVLPAYLLLPGMVSLGMFRLLGSVVSAYGYPQYRTYAALVGVAATVLLDYALIPRIGIAGAAIASTLAYSVGALTMLALYLRLTKSSTLSTVRAMLANPFTPLRADALFQETT